MDKLASQAIAAFTVIFAAGFAFAATISGVSGTIDQWETLTISGSNFGPAPNVVLFDDFELGTDGEDIMTGSGSARYGQWDEQRDTAIYSNITAVSGSLSFRAAAAPDPFGLIIT